MTILLAKPFVPDRHVAVTIFSPDLPLSFTHSVSTTDVEDVLELVEVDFLPRLADTEISVAGRNSAATHSLVHSWMRGMTRNAFRYRAGAERQALLTKVGPVALWSALNHPHFATEMRREVAEQLHGPAGKANIVALLAFQANHHADWAFCVAQNADDPEPAVRHMLDLFSKPPGDGGDWRLGDQWPPEPI